MGHIMIHEDGRKKNDVSGGTRLAGRVRRIKDQRKKVENREVLEKTDKRSRRRLDRDWESGCRQKKVEGASLNKNETS